jgi:molecular chaperone Hsp33
MADQLLVGLVIGCDTALAYALTTDTVAEAIRRHDCDPAAAHLLARAITAGVLASSAMNAGQRLNLRWAYEGLLRTIVVDTGPDGATRGFITPPHLADAADEGALYGESGTVQVIRSHKGAIVSQGTTRADLLDVVEDLNHFLCVSDQVESALAVTVSFTTEPDRPVRVCRGLMLQAMPGCDLLRFQRLRDRLYMPKARDWLARGDESDSSVENLLLALLEGESVPKGIRLDPAAAPVFRCNCGPDKMGAILRALPNADRMDLIRKNEPVSVTCRFCEKRYVLSLDECIRAWNENPADTT